MSSLHPPGGAACLPVLLLVCLTRLLLSDVPTRLDAFNTETSASRDASPFLTSDCGEEAGSLLHQGAVFGRSPETEAETLS